MIFGRFPFHRRPLSMGTCYSSARMEEEGRESVVVGKCVATCMHYFFVAYKALLHLVSLDLVV